LLVEAPPRSRRAVHPAFAIVAALVVTMAVSSVARSIFVEPQPIDVAEAAVGAAAERNESRLAEHSRGSGGEQLVGLVGEGAEVVSVTVSALVGGDAYEAVVELSGLPANDPDRVRLLLESAEDRWVVVEASPSQ
jgi:ABC-type nitrate/sulfonate/bicarbonate transport system permease component